ncbi:MAG: hypothetical protein ABSA94_04950 [Acidobacteriaceae bacterium]
MIRIPEVHGFVGAIHRCLHAVDGTANSWINAAGWASQNKVEDDGIALSCTCFGIVSTEAAKFAIRVPDANAC